MHVAVLGAGYAGIALARTLERTLPDDVAITVVDERETHLVQHLIHRIVRHPSLTEELTIPIADLLDRADHRQARVTDLDPDAGEATLEDGTLSYDVGAVCLGARTAYYGLPGVEDNATPLKRPRHVERIRANFLDVCDASGQAVVVGAGLSGIQVAGELTELAREELTSKCACSNSGGRSRRTSPKGSSGPSPTNSKRAASGSKPDGQSRASTVSGSNLQAATGWPTTSSSGRVG